MTATKQGSGRLSPDILRPTGSVLGANLAISKAIEHHAVAETGYDPTTLDLLVRVDLAPGGRLRASELCRRLMLSPSHISRRLDRAEEVGLVRREPDPVDRRAQQVSLTDEGRRVVADFAPRLEAVIDQVVTQTLTASEIETLVALLARVESAARSLGDTV